MLYDKTFVSAKLNKWSGVMGTLSLPRWEELPAIQIYMDQLISLLGQYLSFFPKELGDEEFITRSTINNYVRLKVIPPPEKKRYSRMHLAYLIVICCLKPALSISYIQKMVPYTLNEEEVKEIYTDFIGMFSRSTEVFIQQIESAASKVLDPNDQSAQTIPTFVFNTALTAVLAKLLTEKVINVQGETDLERI